MQDGIKRESRLGATGALLLRLCAFLAALACIWIPEILHWRISGIELPAEVVRGASLAPSDRILSSLSGIRYDPYSQTPQEIAGRVQEAEGILHGTWSDTSGYARTVSLPFEPADLTAGPSSRQLQFAGLQHLAVLLDAYEQSGEFKYVEAAYKALIAFAEYEHKAVLPKGFLWNDHAIVDRALFITRLWRHVRHTSLSTPEGDVAVLRFVARTARFLSEPRHFTVRTNHGVMQNAALLHLALAFPTLPLRDDMIRVARVRLKVQMTFYQSSEGPILEHSLGYHMLGVSLLQALSTYQSELGIDMDLKLQERLATACQFADDMLNAADTPLPIGDTASRRFRPLCPYSTGEDDAGLREALTREPLRIYSDSGYAIVSLDDEPPSHRMQTVVAWSRFATGAHKHDDEQSLVASVAGRIFLSAVGYWPLDDPRRSTAVSWRGSNAPHFHWETGSEDRQTELLSHASSRSLVFLDLVRSIPERRSTLRRQILIIGGSAWLVVDEAVSSVEAQFLSVWTLAPEWELVRADLEGSLSIRSEGAPPLTLSFQPRDRIRAEVLHGSNEPFGGWIAEGMDPGMIAPATSVELTAGIGQAVATLWSIDRSPGVDRLVRFAATRQNQWNACIGRDTCDISVTREDMQLNVTRNGLTRTYELERGHSDSTASAGVNAAYRDAMARYPAWKFYLPWRSEVSVVLIGLLLAQETIAIPMLLLGIRRYGVHRIRPAAAVYAPALLWLALGLYISLFQLR